MTPEEVKNHLSLYLGLDDGTIQQQILPHLESIRSKNELREYLFGLLGTDAAQTSFVNAYSQTRFRGHPTPASSTLAPKTTLSPASGRPNNSDRGTSSSAAAAAPMTLRPPYNPPPLKKQSAHQAPPATQSSSRGPSPGPSRPQSPSSQNTAGTLLTKPPDGISDTARQALVKVERDLRYARGQGKPKACFCQASLHPVSGTAPICPRCLLVICDLNVPYTSPCPSCKHTPLVTPSAMERFFHEREVARDRIIRGEMERIQFESEEQERERRAVQFPSLDTTGHHYPSFTPTQTQATGYASRAGGVDHHRQIERAYRNAQAREAAIAAAAAAPATQQGGERRVLSLNKKGKATIHTTKTVKGGAGHTSTNSTIHKQKQQRSQGFTEKELEDAREPYVDENDDGVKVTDGRRNTGRLGMVVEGKRDVAATTTGPSSNFKWPARPSGLLYQGVGTTRLGEEEEGEQEEDNDEGERERDLA